MSEENDDPVWRRAVEAVAPVAPAVATALGGPVAGGVTAAASRMVTELLGVENSAEGLIAATQDPAKVEELRRIDTAHKEKLEAMRLEAEMADAAEKTARLTATNKTIRAELDSDSTFRGGWRSGVGWVFMLSCAAIMGALVVSVFRPGADTPALFNSALVMFGVMGAVLGIDINRVGKERLATRGATPESFMDAVKARVRGGGQKG